MSYYGFITLQKEIRKVVDLGLVLLTYFTFLVLVVAASTTWNILFHLLNLYRSYYPACLFPFLRSCIIASLNTAPPQQRALILQNKSVIDAGSLLQHAFNLTDRLVTMQ